LKDKFEGQLPAELDIGGTSNNDKGDSSSGNESPDGTDRSDKEDDEDEEHSGRIKETPCPSD
jgi:hypothetical protein